ncbi:MAG TPA: GlsB/YeaQ/YmgE family stress response membrane protein [Nocardioides sp.]|nr:GlsB/YeaQ/YmgE family stress response membrane protein [Nocardioides sp.]
MLILGIILFGMVVGAGAQLILGRDRGGVDWTMAIVAGLVGSFIGGLLISLLSGDGLDLRPSGIIGSLAGAIIVTAAWRWWDGRNKPTAADRAAKRSGDPRKSNPH